MTPHKQWLKDFQDQNSGTVHMGNDKACKMVGFGKIIIKVDNEPDIHLSGVRYVSELKRNLISLGMLEAHGCKFKAENVELKVLEGDCVKINGVRQNEIYVLHGEVVVNDSLLTILKMK
ncbi:unnamed protein product [Rhodiola kirilowii]